MQDLEKSEGKTIVFFDSKNGLDDLKTIIEKENPLIFTFDIESHKILSENKVDHQISDSYLNNDDFQYIQKKSYEYSKWSRTKAAIKHLTYEGINLGHLSYVEFNYELIPFLKKFVEIKRIYENFKNSEYFVSGLNLKIITLFTKKIRNLNYNTKITSNFLYDSVKVPINIFNRSFSISISRKTYQKIKNIIDDLVSFLLRFKKSGLPFSNKSVLLVEFDTIRFATLLSKKSKEYPNLIIYNRRRPAVWNLKSFLILFNSNCQIINSKDLLDLEIEEKIKSEQNEFVSRFEELVKLDDFYSFFILDGISFWEAIKNEFIALYKKRIEEALYEINIAKKLFELNKLSSILVWSENGFNEQIIIHIAKKYGIVINLIQHGMYYDTNEAIDYNEFNGVFPVYSDNFLAWGEITENYANSCGFGKKTSSLGSPFYDIVFKEKKMIRNEDYVLLATTSPGKNIVTDLTVDTIKKYEDTVKTVCKIVSRTNQKLIVKMHPFQDERDISNIVKSVDKNIKLVKNEDSLSLISGSIAVISIDLSTIILESQILEKPVISIPTKNHPFGNPEIFTSNACLTVKLDNLEEVLTKIIEDNNFRTQLIKSGLEFTKRYLSNQGSSAESILKFLNQN